MAKAASFLHPVIDTWLRDVLHKANVDRPVFFGLLSKTWSLAAVPVSLFLIAKFFSPVLQGYYYTFSTLLALQVFVELGLGTVLIQFVSHEWSFLRLETGGQIGGNEAALSRLTSLAQLAMKWYLAGALIVIITVGGGGYLFFIRSVAHDIPWRAPWFALSLITGVSVCLVPAWSLLEGCNQLSSLYQFRFYQGVFSSISLWITILMGLKLWVLVIAGGVTVIASMLFIAWRYSVFFKQLLFRKPTGDVIKWQKDIFPMQWKIALSWVSGYFSFSLFTPVLFRYHGPVIAGQFGMTWSIVCAIDRMSGVWLAPKAPQFGMLIARQEFEELNKRFWRVTRFFSWVVLMLSGCCWLLVFTIHIFYPVLANRLLPPFTVGVLLMAQALAALSSPFSVYLRAHKQEPLLILSVATGVLTAISTVFLGKYYAATGMTLGYLLVNLITTPFVFLVWFRCQKAWHTQPQIVFNATSYPSGFLDDRKI